MTKTMTPPLTARDISVHIAKTMSFTATYKARANWQHLVAEHGINLAEEYGAFTVELEDGRKFTVKVTETDTKPWTVQSVPCPWKACGAGVGQPCTGLDGEPLTRVPAHYSRTEAAFGVVTARAGVR